MKIFKYKSLYNQEHAKYLALLKKSNTREKENVELIKDLKNQIVILEGRIAILHNSIQLKDDDKKKLSTEIERINHIMKLKEMQRRKSAGKIGGLTAAYNNLLKEKKEMLALIDRLLLEIKKLSKDKKKTTLQELRNYFKTKY